jgi:hypothetical protein
MTNVQEYFFSKENIISLSNKLGELLQIDTSSRNAKKYCQNFIIPQMEILFKKYKHLIKNENPKKFILKLNQKSLEECIKLYKSNQTKKTTYSTPPTAIKIQEPKSDRIPPTAEILERLVLERQNDYETNINSVRPPPEPNFRLDGTDNRIKDSTIPQEIPPVKNDDNPFNQMNGFKGMIFPDENMEMLESLPSDLLNINNFMEVEKIIEPSVSSTFSNKSKKPIQQFGEHELNMRLQQMQNERNYISSSIQENRNTISKNQYITPIDPLILLKMSSDDIEDYIKTNMSNYQPPVVDNDQMLKMLLELKEKNNENKKILSQQIEKILVQPLIITIDSREVVKDPCDYSDYLYPLKEKINGITGINMNNCIFPPHSENYFMYFSFSVDNITSTPCAEISIDGSYEQTDLHNQSIPVLEEIIIQFKNKNGDLIDFEGNHHIIEFELKK